MKVRNGWVSNSSTTSFCMFGTYYEYSRDDDDDVYDSWLDKIDELCSKYGLNYCNDYESNMIFIGLNPEQLKDDETGAQFKQRAKDSIDKLFAEINVIPNQLGWESGEFYA